MTLRELVDAYMAAYAGRDRTRPAVLARWCAALGDRPFATLTDQDVFSGLEAIRTEPARVYKGRDEFDRPIFEFKPKPRTPATVNRYHAALAAVFTWAIKRRLAPRGFEHPCRNVERLPERNAVVRFLSQAELTRLLAACRTSGWPRLYLLVVMAITTGARRSELLALTWGELDTERAIAHVRETKNGHPRALPLTPTVLEELARFRLPTTKPEHCLFPSRGVPTKPRVFEPSWRAALKAAQIERFRFHDLRHSCASYLAQNGASLLEIADVMGHRQLAMVKRYAHLTTDTKAKLVNRILGDIR
ncbi:MAG: site-specific integrase [Betaproteobacteria bacterium]|nr:site-specific integrase [Betaproteobacteria bacterium]